MSLFLCRVCREDCHCTRKKRIVKKGICNFCQLGKLCYECICHDSELVLSADNSTKKSGLGG